MTVGATPTTYSRLAGENFGGAIFLHHTIKKELRYSYASLSFNAFSKEFDSHKWCSRKLSAMALGVTLIASITFQIIRLFVALFTCPSKESLKIKVYHLTRSAEAFGGSLLTLFWDRLGSFVVQRASFHVSCYNSFETQSFISKPSQIKHLEILHKNGFIAFKKLDRMIQTALWEELQLPSTVEDFLKNEALAKLVFDALVEFKSGQLDLKYAFISKDNFWNVKVGELKNLHPKEIAIFRQQFYMLTESKRLLDDPIADIEQATLGQLCSASAEALTPHLSALPPHLFRLLTPYQLETVDFHQANIFTRLDLQDLNYLFHQLSLGRLERVDFTKATDAVLNLLQIPIWLVRDENEAFLDRPVSDFVAFMEHPLSVFICYRRFQCLPAWERNLSSDPIQTFETITLRQFCESSGRVLTPHLNTIPRIFLSLLTQQQVETLDVQEFRLDRILGGVDQDCRTFFDKLSDQQLHSINVQNILFANSFLMLTNITRLSAKQLIDLNYRYLVNDQYQMLAERLESDPALLKQIPEEQLGYFPQALQTKLKGRCSANP